VAPGDKPTREAILSILGDTHELVRDRVATGWLLDYSVVGREIRVYGDVRVRGNLELSNAVHVVDGDLEVTGCLEDDADESVLIVRGDIRAKHFINSSAAIVGGAVRVAGVIYGDSGNNRELFAAGPIAARAVVEAGHIVATLAEFEAEHVLCLLNHVESKRGIWDRFDGSLADVFKPSVLDDDEQLDVAALFAAMKKGLDPVRPSSATPRRAKAQRRARRRA
jgi:hypothetical protein